MKNKGKSSEKKKKKGFTFGKFKVLILVGVLIYMGATFITQQSALDKQRVRRAELLAQQEELEHELELKKSELNYIGSDEYVEQQARERLGWLKEDEILYVDGSEQNKRRNPAGVQQPSGEQEQEAEPASETDEYANEDEKPEDEEPDTPTEEPEE